MNLLPFVQSLSSAPSSLLLSSPSSFILCSSPGPSENRCLPSSSFHTKRLNVIKQNRRFKYIQSNSYKTNYLRLREAPTSLFSSSSSRRSDSTVPGRSNSSDDRTHTRLALAGECFQLCSPRFRSSYSTKRLGLQHKGFCVGFFGPVKTHPQAREEEIHP